MQGADMPGGHGYWHCRMSPCARNWPAPNCALVVVFLFGRLIIIALPETKEEIHKTMIEISVRPSRPLDNYQKGF